MGATSCPSDDLDYCVLYYTTLGHHPSHICHSLIVKALDLLQGSCGLSLKDYISQIPLGRHTLLKLLVFEIGLSKNSFTSLLCYSLSVKRPPIGHVRVQVPDSWGYFGSWDPAGESGSLDVCFGGLYTVQSLPPSPSGPVLCEEFYLPQVPMMLSPSIDSKRKPDQA